MRVGHPCSLECAQLSRGLRIDKSCTAPRPEISKPPGSTSAKLMLFVVFLSAHVHESVVRDRSEVAYNPHPRRRSSVVEQPPCKRQVVCSIQTGGTSSTSSYPIGVFGGPSPAVGGLLAVTRGSGQAPRICRLSSSVRPVLSAGAMVGGHPLTGERADMRPAIRYANPHPATLIYWECVPGRLATHEIRQRGYWRWPVTGSQRQHAPTRQLPLSAMATPAPPYLQCLPGLEAKDRCNSPVAESADNPAPDYEAP